MLLLVQVYGDNAMKKTAVYKWVKCFFWEKRKCHWRREIRTDSNKQNWRKHYKISSNFALKSSTDCQKHSRASEHRQTVRKILTEDLDMRKVCAKMVPKELTEEQKQRRVFSYWTNNCVGTHCLFTGSSIKEISKGRHFDDTDDIRSNTTEAQEVHATKPVPKLFWRVD